MHRAYEAPLLLRRCLVLCHTVLCINRHSNKFKVTLNRHEAIQNGLHALLQTECVLCTRTWTFSHHMQQHTLPVNIRRCVFLSLTMKNGLKNTNTLRQRERNFLK